MNVDFQQPAIALLVKIWKEKGLVVLFETKHTVHTYFQKHKQILFFFRRLFSNIAVASNKESLHEDGNEAVNCLKRPPVELPIPTHQISPSLP